MGGPAAPARLGRRGAPRRRGLFGGVDFTAGSRARHPPLSCRPMRRSPRSASGWPPPSGELAAVTAQNGALAEAIAMLKPDASPARAVTIKDFPARPQLGATVGVASWHRARSPPVGRRPPRPSCLAAAPTYPQPWAAHARRRLHPLGLTYGRHSTAERRWTQSYRDAE
jgi:hypothetical protein